MSSAPRSRDHFKVAIICALPLEHNAVYRVFDKIWDDEGDEYGRAVGDPNQYTTGRVAKHNVVLSVLPHMGKVDAASAAASMRSSFPALRLALIVGICGGAPEGQSGKILLGDVVISKTVVQYDFGRQYPDKFVRKDTIWDNLARPNKDIRGLLAVFATDSGMARLERRTAAVLAQLQSSPPTWRRSKKDKYKYPGRDQDKLFEKDYRHKHRGSVDCICGSCAGEMDPVCGKALEASCAELGCADEHLVAGERLGEIRTSKQDGSPAVSEPAIHLGVVASGDTVMKSAAHRDTIIAQEKAIAFDMEGAGVWDEVPCIVVKGVCDYADSHKNKKWQDYAAATAASAAKAILERYAQTDDAQGAVRNGDNGGGIGVHPGQPGQTSEVGNSRDQPDAAHHGQPERRVGGPVFHGPITGHNVISGLYTTGGTANYTFNS